MDVPEPGQWPVDPQEDQDIQKDRIWIDGCFDFAHHGRYIMIGRERYLTSTGHAGAILQARQLGKELYVGLHSDKDIMENKGPTVMTLDERCVSRTMLMLVFH